VKTFLASALTVFLASIASAQNVPSIQESGNIWTDITRQSYSGGGVILNSPFNMGFINNPTSPLIGALFTPINIQETSPPTYNPDFIVGYEYTSSGPLNSAIGLDYTTNESIGVSNGFLLANEAVTLFSADVLPCVEAQLPKGTYTFQATAFPVVVGASTPGNFVFETQTAGVWTQQFSLALPKPEGATRTLTFAHDTKVRWFLRGC
jgi:hypothetical protein